MKCNQCGHENKDTAKFCEKCGSKLGSSHCPECGHENRSGAQFCQDCGAVLRKSAKAAPVRSSSPKPGGMPTAVIILLSLAGFVVTTIVALFLFRDAIGLNFFGSGKSKDSTTAAESSPQVARISYTSNPAPVVEVGKPFEVVYDWTASTEELVQQFIDNSEHQVMVNGEMVSAKISYGAIVEDYLNGGFKTQVAANFGLLPAGKSEIETTISFKQPISNGSENFGPGTEKEHVKKHGKVVIKDPTNPQASDVDHSVDNCPPAEDVYSTDLVWDGDTPGVGIVNKQGWESWSESPADPAIFTSGGYMWAHPVCSIYPDDPTLLICEGEFDQPAPNKDEIGIYLPYPWSESRDGWCVFEDLNLTQAEVVVECPTKDDIFPGEVYWEKGLAMIDIENPAGWEPYAEQEEFPSFLAVNDEHYTDLNCEVDSDDNTTMICSGPGTIKTGGMGMFLNFPYNNSFCQLAFDEIGIKDICNEGYRFCVYSGACCPNSQVCDINGCHTEQHDDHDDHD